MKVVLIGVGALGSNLVLCARSIEGLEWTIVDFDRVEFKNTQSQFHPVTSIGKSKVESMRRTMFGLFKHRIDGRPVKLTDQNVEQLLGGADLVVDCLDNAPARESLKAWTDRHDVPCLHGGVAEDGEFGIVRWDDNFAIDKESAAGQQTCEAGEHTPFMLLVSSAMAVALQEFAADSSRRLNFNITPESVQRI